MFYDCVDDQYIGCSSMRQKSRYIPLEGKYNKTWETARSHWYRRGQTRRGQTVGSFDPIYGTAIVAYTVGDDLYRDFNTAVREAGKSQNSYDQFAFKHFFFLLTKALQAKKTDDRCYEVFRGIKGIHFTVSDEVVRFGQFASSSLDKKVAQKFGEDTLFSVKTCYGVPIYDFSYHKDQKEVLIPPYETFTVINHKSNRNGVFIRLESRGVFSRFNCGVLNGDTMRNPTIQMVPLLCLIGFFTGPLQVQTEQLQQQECPPP
ncbi:NAD(P)(+)--arginine ADP-ribosyltransferase 2-like [Protobothrops mucrosquamatus]|uniref:NAD(P)(+)--arginine ADP-ribosyltransferase 2-like n=1 Tax=Protobothrops mucrosquamatus TaxID=103944 RepID=UPI0010FAFFB5|nr:NAD(P)(+)--arginine ADP-ribosyltransferase 2-like [Protobothrops mucrosquamatus]